MMQWEIDPYQSFLFLIFVYFLLVLFVHLNWLAIELHKNYVKILVKHIRLMCILVRLKRYGYTINKLFNDNKELDDNKWTKTI